MTIERIIRIVAGSFVLLSLFLGLTVSHWWFLFTAFVGFNLLQSGITNICPLEFFLKRFGYGGCCLRQEKTLAKE